MSEFTVSGRYQARDGWQGFETTLEAPNESVARERTYANLGSQHALKRTEIEIGETRRVSESRAASGDGVDA